MLTKTNNKPLAKKAKKTKSLKVKHVMLVDTGDGCFTDDSVKVKPHKKDPTKVVFKCVDAARLLKALTDAGLCAVKVIKGSKHHIAFVEADEFQTALAAHKAESALLSSPSAKLLS